jgi:DNA-binding transcriptional regulator LsrR (DeoR family)
MRRQPDVRQAFDQFKRVTIAVGAVGSWAPRNSLMLENPALSNADRTRLLRRGVVAEFAATLVTDGGEVVHDLDARCLAISEQQIRAIRTRIAVAGGAKKTRAIRAVLTSRLVNGLVTDAATAERLLAA